MIKWLFILLGVVSLSVCGALGYLFVSATRLPENAPRAFLGKPAAPGQKVVVCLGDSLTHGRVSHNYVADLAARYPADQYRFVNAGINSELAYNVLRRIDAVIALMPDYVIILIGTNDALAAISPKSARRYVDKWDLPQTPTRKWFQQNLAEIVDRLKKETRARIALLSLPPITEDDDHPGYRHAQSYSIDIREMATRKAVAYLPLNEKMRAVVAAKTRASDYEFFGPERVLLYKAIAEHYLLGRSWNEISKNCGFVLLTDFIHLNETAAGIVTVMIDAFIQRGDKD